MGGFACDTSDGLGELSTLSSLLTLDGDELSLDRSELAFDLLELFGEWAALGGLFVILTGTTSRRSTGAWLGAWGSRSASCEVSESSFDCGATGSSLGSESRGGGALEGVGAEKSDESE